jgi:hypothetical protein
MIVNLDRRLTPLTAIITKHRIYCTWKPNVQSSAILPAYVKIYNAIGP